jgi:hypothetical protein
VVLDVCRRCIEPHQRYDAGVWEELHGIAEGAGLSDEMVLILNGLTDIRDACKVAAGIAWSKQAPEEGGCTSWLAAPEATTDEHALAGQTWDMAAAAMEFIVVVRRTPERGPATISMTTAGCLSLVGINSAGLAIGNNNLLMWPYDAPEAIHRLMAFLRDDRLTYLDFLERENLLGLNNVWTFVGSGSPGYCTALPQPDYAGAARLRDLWIWMESQETVAISPAMFAEFFLPYMAAVARKVGLVYYGCCEPVHDRWESVREAMPHVRAVSISPWCDMRLIAEKLGRTCVFSRKPRPAPISGAHADWAGLEQDIDETVSAAQGCNLEIIFRDVYRIGGDRTRLRRWAEMVRRRIEG